MFALEAKGCQFESDHGYHLNIGETYDNVVLRYRVAVINDFKAVTAVVDLQKWGPIEQVSAWQVVQPHRSYQDSSDAIHIFLNFAKIATTKNKSEAIQILNDLARRVPKELNKDMLEYKEILSRSF